MGSPSFLSGTLRSHSSDLTRIQRLLDPLIAGLLFGWLNPLRLEAANLTFSWLLVILVTALVLPQGRLYQSYRQSSLITLMRRLTASWLLVLGALLLIAFLLKVSDEVSRLSAVQWA